MKRIVTTLAALATLLLVSAAVAATFNPPPGAVVRAVVTQTGGGYTAVISWENIPDVAKVQQYFAGQHDGKWMADHPAVAGSVTLDPMKGDRFQLINGKDEFLLLTREMLVSNYSALKLVGVTMECGDPRGCALQLLLPGSK